MNSKQERLIHAISSFSYGDAFVFAPDEWQKGNARREPADVIWSANGCLMLMYMKESGGTRDDPVRNRSKRDKFIKTNLCQASGALRRWRSGSPIKGSNRFKSFSIPHEQSLPLVVLSLAETGCAIAQYHHEKACEMGVAMCATIPTSALDYLAHMGGSMLDLMFFLIHLSSRKGSWSEDETNKALNVYWRNASQQSGVLATWPGGDDGRFRIASDLLIGLRSIAPESRTVMRRLLRSRDTDLSPDRVSPLAEIFNDIRLVDNLILVAQTAALLDLAARRRDVVRLVKLAHYDIVLCAMIEFDPSYTAPIDVALDAAKRIDRRGVGYVAPVIFHFIKPRVSVCRFGFAPRPFPSAANTLLTSWANAQGTPLHVSIMQTIADFFLPVAGSNG